MSRCAQVTTGDLTAELAPLTGATRLLALSAMRSLFGTLKARRVLFTNPAAPLTGRQVPPPPVLPLEDGLRAGLLGRLHEPAERLIVLLAGVHALRPAGICALTLDDADPAAGTLLRRRPRPAAGPAHRGKPARLAAGPARPLAGHRQPAPADQPEHRRRPRASQPPLHPAPPCAGLGITAQDLRADRLLAEAQASGGDPLQLTHLFGISDPIAIRYCAEAGPLERDAQASPARPG